MDIKKIEKLINKGESDQIEFKKTTAQLRAAFETICSFLNSFGGTVFIGVTDDGKAVGQEITDHTKQEIAHEMNKVEPPAEIKIAYIPIGKQKYIIQFQVSPGKQLPYVYDGRPYQREQTVTRRMSQQRHDQLVTNRRQLNFSWELFSAENITVDQLNQDTIWWFVKEAVDQRRLPATALKDSAKIILEKLKLIEADVLLNAAIALFGTSFLPYYPQCQLRMARFKGVDKKEFLDSDVLYGNAFELLEKGEFFIKKHLPLSGKVISGQLRREELLLIPYTAVREALVNAICHRDYNYRGASIGLAIYDDRMEIANPGGWPANEFLKIIEHHTSKLRNPLIAEIFHKIGYIEKWGRGIQEIFSSCKIAGDPEPEFHVDENEFKLIFYFPLSLNSKKEFLKKPHREERLQLSERQQQIINVLSKTKTLSSGGLLKKLSLTTSERTLRRELNLLKEKGFLLCRGEGPARQWYGVEDKNKK